MSFHDRFKNCHCEHRLQNTTPFYFEYTTQPIMLITSVPSFQAAFRQLASIRFFRAVFLALFGPNPKIPADMSLIHFFQQNIYWTHYHKCYMPKDNEIYNYRNPPEVCRGKHLEWEIDNFNPKLIVIFGAPVVKRLTQKVLQEGAFCEAVIKRNTGRRIPAICANFPKTGAEEEMVSVRERIKHIIPQVDSKRVPQYMVSDLTFAKDTFVVHANYEYKALEMYWDSIVSSTKPPYKQDNIDNLWIKHEVIPKSGKYAFIVSCCSFIEDQVGALLAENQELEKVYLAKEDFPDILRQLFPLYDCGLASNDTDKLLQDIYFLRRIRNKIVHSGGRLNYLSPKDKRLKERIMSTVPKELIMIEPSGMISLTDKYCEYALSLVGKFVKYIAGFKTRY